MYIACLTALAGRRRETESEQGVLRFSIVHRASPQGFRVSDSEVRCSMHKTRNQSELTMTRVNFT